LFERFFIGVYEVETGETDFFDVMQPPPRARALRQEERLTFDGVIQEIRATYNERNNPPFVWANDKPTQ
jgi:hypothetical protein